MIPSGFFSSLKPVISVGCSPISGIFNNTVEFAQHPIINSVYYRFGDNGTMTPDNALTESGYTVYIYEIERNYQASTLTFSVYSDSPIGQPPIDRCGNSLVKGSLSSFSAEPGGITVPPIVDSVFNISAGLAVWSWSGLDPSVFPIEAVTYTMNYEITF